MVHVVPFDSLTLEATRILDRAVLAPLLDNWDEPNSDFIPVLDLGTEKTRFMREVADGFSATWTQGFNVSAALMSRKAGEFDDRLAPMPGLGTVYSRAMSARARRGGTYTDEDLQIFPGLDDFLHRQWVYKATLASPTPPRDWHRWALDFVGIEEDLHRGTSGYVDTSFYNEAMAYARKHRAPPELVQSIRFLRGVEEWDYATVSQAADSLIQLIGYGPGILAKDFLRDAGTVAKLKIRDVEGARSFFDQLVQYGSRSPSHLQSRLLVAHLEAAEARMATGGR
jgi:hypothetical protein